MSERVPLGRYLDEGPDDAALDRLWRERQLRKQRHRSWLPMGLAVAAVAVVMVLVWPRASGPLALVSGHMPGGVSSTTERVAFDDGSVVTLDSGARFAVKHNDGEHFDTVLEAGRVRLSVTPGGPRRWTIDCGIARVVVVGTELVIDRKNDAVEVGVTHGRVLVQSTHLEGGEVAIGAGETVRVTVSGTAKPEVPAARPEPSFSEPRNALATPSEPPAPDREPTPDEPSRPAPVEPAPTPPPPSAAANLPEPVPTPEAAPRLVPPLPTPRAPTTERVSPEAVPREPKPVPDSSPEPVPDSGAEPTPTPERPTAEPTPGSLLDAADTARRSGDTPRAVALLEQFLTLAPNDYRAPLAAFSLGRLEADVLGRPARAAAAFERALPRLPKALEADALARLALARNALGQREQARAAARHYLETHPDGPRSAAMRALVE